MRGFSNYTKKFAVHFVYACRILFFLPFKAKKELDKKILYAMGAQFMKTPIEKT